MNFATNLLGRTGTLNGVPANVPQGISNGLTVEIVGVIPSPSGISDAYNQPIWLIVRTAGKQLCELPMYCVYVDA